MPTGIKDLTFYPLGPTAAVLSWNRPYLGVFRKYVVEMFYFNPSTMTSEWMTYYEIAATVSLTSSVVKKKVYFLPVDMCIFLSTGYLRKRHF